jgi:hypothetical protein
MEFEKLTPADAQYPHRLRERLQERAPALYVHGPLKLLDRFSLGVICADQNPGEAMLATNDMLFKIREYALNYIGPWHAVLETEIFRLALDTPTDPQRRRSVTICTARGLARETWDNFLGDRFGYEGPFTGFPQKEEFYRRAREGELLWVSITDPHQKRFIRANILLRNLVTCALADVVFVPFAAPGMKTFVTVKEVLKLGVPMFTCQYYETKEADDNKHLFALGIPSYSRKEIGKYLESLGARTDTPAPFPPKEEVEVGYTPPSLVPPKKLRQASLL